MTEPIELSETQRETLRAVCDTVVPRVDPPHEIRTPPPRFRGDPGEGRGDGFWTTTASDAGVDRALEQLIAGLPEELAVGLFFLLEVLAAQGFAAASQEGRERQLADLAGLSADAALGVQAYRQLTLLLHYGMPFESGRNPSWAALGYPGPVSAPPDEPRVIRTIPPSGSDLTLDADVCVVGSGAGGAWSRRRWPRPGSRSWCSRPAATSNGPTSTSSR